MTRLRVPATFVRRIIDEAGLTPYSAAKKIGISPRAMRRHVSLGKDFRPAPMVVLVALKGLRLLEPAK